MELTTEDKIFRYHYEEILLILFICACDIDKYNDDELVLFAEAIEGRVEVLFDELMLSRLTSYLKTTPEAFKEFFVLKSNLTALYSSQWHTKMNEKNDAWRRISLLAKNLIGVLGIKYIEPVYFMEQYLNID